METVEIKTSEVPAVVLLTTSHFWKVKLSVLHVLVGSDISNGLIMFNLVFCTYS
jgi:hypothetical protein